MRCGKTGFYTGVEKTFFTAEAECGTVRISYEPSLILKKGETYESEPQFLGSYECTGEYIYEKEPINLESLKSGVRRPRFFNPCGEIGLDIAEMLQNQADELQTYSATAKSPHGSNLKTEAWDREPSEILLFATQTNLRIQQ